MTLAALDFTPGCDDPILSVIECFETDGGVNYRSDRLILF
jgi:hypothetical protein